jgi:hypothetical protein
VAGDGTVTITATLPAADGAVVLQALRAAAGDCEHPHRPRPGLAEDTAPAGSAGQGDGTCQASLADALVEVAGAYLSAKIAAAGNPDIYHVIVPVGPEALAGGPAAGDLPARPGAGAEDGSDGSTAQHRVSAETSGDRPADLIASPARRPAGHPAHPQRCRLDDGPAIAAAAARALACDATTSWMLHDHDGTLLDVGRRHRRATPALRRAVRERDKSRCRFPGCHSRRTDIHHIVPWAKGGKTRLRDLILLCHHHPGRARRQTRPRPGHLGLLRQHSHRPGGQPAARTAAGRLNRNLRPAGQSLSLTPSLVFQASVSL